MEQVIASAAATEERQRVPCRQPKGNTFQGWSVALWGRGLVWTDVWAVHSKQRVKRAGVHGRAAYHGGREGSGGRTERQRNG